MARADARNVNPSLSSDPRDKLAAALCWHYGQFKQSREYRIAPIYFDMLVEWHEKLSAEDKELVLTLADVVAVRTRTPPRSWLRHCHWRRGVRSDQWIGTVNPNENDGS